MRDGAVTDALEALQALGAWLDDREQLDLPEVDQARGRLDAIVVRLREALDD